jgi:tetratricopeptide (TPR) repeat protein
MKQLDDGSMTHAEPVDPRGLVGHAREAEERGDTARSLWLYDEAIELLKDESDLELLADALRWKGTLHREQGETEAAYRCYKESLRYAVRCGSVRCKAHCYNCLAIVAQRRGNLNECERLYMHAANLASKAGDIRLLGIIEHNRGVLMNIRCKYLPAETRYASSLSAFEKVGDDQSVSSVLNNLGILYTKLGHYQRAVETLGRGLEIARARNDAMNESILTLTLAEAWVAAGRLDQAEDACALALELARDRGDHLTMAGALKCRARIERERGAFGSSITTLRIGIREAEVLEDRLLQAELLRELGQTSQALGNAADARLAWREAAESFEGLDARHEAAEISALLATLPAERHAPVPTRRRSSPPSDEGFSPSP